MKAFLGNLWISPQNPKILESIQYNDFDHGTSKIQISRSFFGFYTKIQQKQWKDKESQMHSGSKSSVILCFGISETVDRFSSRRHSFAYIQFVYCGCAVFEVCFVPFRTSDFVIKLWVDL